MESQQPLVVLYCYNKITDVKISTKLVFFSNLEKVSDSEIKNAADGLQIGYFEDLESYLYEELVQVSLNENCSGINIWMYQFVKKDWASIFPILKLRWESTSVWYVEKALGKDHSQN